MRDRLKLLFIPRDQTGCGFYRILLPASKIKDLHLADVEICDIRDLTKAQWADIVIVQRPSEVDDMIYISKVKAMDKRVVVEHDDLLWGTGPGNSAWKYWNPMGDRLGMALELIKQADAVTTTTERLANEYSMFNEHIHVLPNYLDGELWDKPRSWTKETQKEYEKKKKDKYIRIGFAGSYSHEDDIKLIASLIMKVIEDFENVIFVFMGFNPLDFFAKMALESFRVRGGKEPPIQWVQGTGLLEYPDKLMAQAFDIGIAPLVERGFNECKSDLKLKEYGALGIPTVASNIKPYSNSLQNGKTGILAETGKDWYEALKKLIEDKDLRKKMGRNARKFYEDSRIDYHIEEWLRAYAEIENIKYQW